MVAAIDDPWDHFYELIERLQKGVRGVSAVAVNSTSLKTEANDVVQYYFRHARPDAIQAGIKETDLQQIDDILQNLNTLRRGNNRKSSYLSCITSCRKIIATISVQRDKLVGINAITPAKPATGTTPQQQRVIHTLNAMLPLAATSFAQVLNDLADTSRISFRGPVAELREILREVIDHLAPDSTVISAFGFQCEKDRNSPTIRQKVRFIMKSRRKGSHAVATAEDAWASLDGLARSLYNRGSAATHSAKGRDEVLRIQSYTEALLIDLLEI
jgi:Predicted pPIWI-associating nuclease